MVDLAFLLVPASLLFFTRRMFQPFVLSPVKIVAVVLMGITVAGVLAFHDGRAPSGATFKVAPEGVGAAATMFIVSATALMIGAILFVAITASPKPIPSVEAAANPRTGWLYMALVACAVAILASGPTELLSRSTYGRGEAGDIAVGATAFAALAGVAVLGYLAAVRPKRRLVFLLVSLAFWAVLFSLATRQFALAPIVFAVAGYAYQRGKNWARLIAVSIPFAIYLAPIPVFMRGQAAHGLLPYLKQIGAYPGIAGGIEGALGTVLSAFPISALTAMSSPAVTVHQLLIEVNPLPGNLAGWYGISRAMRINEYVPFSAVGELRSAGWGALLLGWVLLGATLAYMDRRSALWLDSGRRVVAVMMVGAAALFAVQAIQYNLRSGVRLLWYVIAIDLMMRFLLVLRRRRAAEPPAARAGRLTVRQ